MVEVAPELETSPVPDLKLAQHIFTLQKKNLASQHAAATDALLESIKTHSQAPLYYYLHTSDAIKLVTPFSWDSALYEELKERNNEEISRLKAAIEAVEKEDDGETESLNGWIKLGEYYAKIGDLSNAITTLRKAQELAPSSGSKIDILFTIVRLGFFFDDKIFVQKQLDVISNLIERGGDWERRNRFKTYRGVYLMAVRNFSEASDLLIDSLATFTSTELCSYEQIAEYSVISGAISLERIDLKKKIIDSPEILSQLTSSKLLEPVVTMVNALYTCDYQTFFQALVEVHDENLSKSVYLAPHASYYLKEMRRKAYAQLLESYKALSLKSMAEGFGVSVEFLDEDLNRFIPTKKLNCVIDRVNGIIMTNRPDTKNAQYQQLIKQGDALLTKLQKYGAAVRLSGAERV